MSLPEIDLVVTRHDGLIQFLQEKGYLSGNVRRISHASPEDVEGLRVLGILPLHLACHAASVTEPIMEVRPEDRGKEMDAEGVERCFRGFRTYKVTIIEP